MNKMQTIIFDWGRTLHDPETDTLFDGVLEIIPELSKKYVLALVSLAKSDSPAGRRKVIDESGISQYFKIILVGGEDKDEMYDSILLDNNITPDTVVIVDDRMVRGIAWGNKKGAKTIWVKRGKFADELPNEQTRNPAFTIDDIKELRSLLL